MKLDQKHLIETGEDITPGTDFEKLMSALNSADWGNIKQAMQMYDLGAYELSDNEDIAAKKAITKGIIIYADAGEVLPSLEELNFDFHNEFTQVYGVTPPRGKEFILEESPTSWGNDQIAMRLKVGKGNELEFHFWWDSNHPDHPSDPWIYMLSLNPLKGTLENVYIDQDKGQLKVEFEGRYGTAGSKLTKEEVPTIIRQAMGWTYDEVPSEWPGLPKGQPPADGPEGTDEPVYESKDDFDYDTAISNILNPDKSTMTPNKVVSATNATAATGGKFQRPAKGHLYNKKTIKKRNTRLNRENLYTAIAEVMSETEEDQGFLDKARELIISNDASMVLQGLELYSVGNLSYTRVPYVLDSLEKKGGHYDYLFLGVENRADARNLIDFLRRHRTKSATRPKQDRRGARIQTYAFGTPKTAELKMDLEEGNYVVEILLDMPKTMSEIGENFGGTPSGDLLHEAWDSQWPSNFNELKVHIKDFTDKGKAAEDILAKYAIESLTFNFLRAGVIWNAYGRLFKSFVRTYVRDEGDLTKVRKFINQAFSQDSKAGWQQKHEDARRDKGNEAALRVLNKYVSSLDKQIQKLWRSMEDKGIDWSNIAEEFDGEVIKAIKQSEFREASAITSRILEIINFVNEDKSDDNAKKLAAFYKKIKQAANSPEIDVSAIADEVNIVQLSLDFVEDQTMNIDMTLCPDAEVGAPCVMHNFDDGFFWHDISADTCELTARKMNSCGDASMSGSELFNLMSRSETGKPRWHVTVEWNEEEKAFIQILGNANTVPKQEYWPYIKWLYEKYGKPEISNYAWEHVQGDNVKPRVFAFLQYLGLKSQEPLSETWTQMKQQISDGFYNVRSWGDGERPVEDDWSKLTWLSHADRVSMAMRIKRRLISQDSIETEQFSFEDVRDYKAAARKLENAGTIATLLFQDMIPAEWDEFFDSEGITQRVRFSHRGNMVLYFNWTSKTLQDPSDGNYRDDEYMKELQRKALARFMDETKQNFDAEAMTRVGRLVAKYLEKDADNWAMERAAYDRGDDLDEGKKKTKLDRNYLTSMILEVLGDEYSERKKEPYHDMMLDFDNPETVLHGIYLLAASELEIFTDGKHDFEEIGNSSSFLLGQDEYIFEVDSKQEALKLQEALRDFYQPIQREIYISADWYGGPPRVMMDIPK